MLECLQSMHLDQGWGFTHMADSYLWGPQILSPSHVHLQVQLELLTKQRFPPGDLLPLTLSTHSRQDVSPASAMVQNLPRLPFSPGGWGGRLKTPGQDLLPQTHFLPCSSMLPYHVRKMCMYPDIFGVSETSSRCFHILLSF